MSVPFVPCANTAQVTMEYFSAGQKCANVWHFLGTSPWTSATLVALNAYMLAWETTHAAPIRSNQTSCYNAYAVDLSTQNGPFAQTAASITGAETGNVLPNSVTLAFKFGTALRGRSFRGRHYWIGLMDNMLTADSQSVIAGTANSIAAVLDLVRSGTIPNSGSLVVRSIRSGGAWRSSGVMTPVTGITLVDYFVDNQRRRLPSHNVHR